MTPFSWLLIFGSLALCVGAIVFGLWMHNGYGMILLVVGIIGCVAWLVGLFGLANALNSDI